MFGLPAITSSPRHLAKRVRRKFIRGCRPAGDHPGVGDLLYRALIPDDNASSSVIASS